MTLASGTRLGPYSVTAKLGEGGMGEVYRARDTQLDRDVALKILPESFADDPDRLMRFEREAKTLAALNHPNIAAIYGIEHAAGQRALVMELVEGDDLSDRIAHGAIPLDDALPIARQIAEALEAAHDAGVIHRDLKPANIKVRADGTVKVLDFGLAKAAQGVQGDGSALRQQDPSPSTMTSPAMTAMGMILGTAAYMAPEQAKGRAVDRRADIWAFGVVLYEMLTGRRAFQGEDVSDLLVAVLSKDVDLTALPPATPARVRRLIARCLDRNPRTRLQHIGEARITLTDTAGDDLSAPAAPTPARPLWRQPSAWMLVAAVAAVSAGLTWWAAQPVSQVSSAPVTRFSVALPSGNDFINPTSREIAISPAGSAVAFEWNDQLWIRRFEEREPTLLVQGVVHVRNPFFSPDGQYVGFFVDGQMMRVAVSGGPPDVIGGPTGERPSGASWADDGYIYVGIGGDISRLPETGGVPEVIIDIPDGQQASNPQLLPGGRWMLFTLLDGLRDWDEAQIVAQSLESSERRVLVTSGRAGWVTPTGHLLYVFGGVLYARAFDTEAIAVTGGAVPIVSNVRTAAANYTGAAFFEVSPRGDLIYVDGATGMFSPTRLAWLDRSGRETLLPIEAQPFYHMDLSPDGRRIAAAVRPSAQQSDIWLYAADRPGAQRLTSTGLADAPVWSPDGQWIYYNCFNIRQPEAGGICRRRADLGGESELVFATSEALPWSISADGRVLATYLLKPQTIEIALISIGDSPPQMNVLQTPGPALNPSLSPDGRFVAFETDDGNGDFAVYVMEVATGRLQMISAGVGLNPVWSRTGDEIFFWSDADMRSVRVVSADRLEFTTPVTLFTRPAHRNEFDVTGDGKRLLHVVPDREAGSTSQVQIQVVLNWFDELKSRVPRQ